jgi:hypothetical protein
MILFYHIQSDTMSPCTLTRDALVEAQNSWLCPGCGAPKPGIDSIDVQLDGDPSGGSPLNFVNGTSVPLALKSFLFRLGLGVLRQQLHLGRVIGPRGRTLDDWVTFRGRRRVTVRGSKNVSHRTCNICGRHVYFAMGKRYLYPAPPSDATVMESDLFGLVLSQDLIGKLAPDERQGLTVDELPVLESPLDSLGKLL